MSNQKTWERQQFEKAQLEKYGVITYSRQSTEHRSDVTVIPVEIEVPSKIDAFTKFEMLDEYGKTYKTWIQQCYLHRMRDSCLFVDTKHRYFRVICLVLSSKSYIL